MNYPHHPELFSTRLKNEKSQTRLIAKNLKSQTVLLKKKMN
jgi:hypothetical protein